MNAPNFLKLITATAMVSGSLFAQTPAASTDPVGFVSTTVPAQSDAVLAVPLFRAAEFKGVIQSISGNVLTVSGTPNWTADQFVQALPGQTKTYAVLIASGTKEGMIGRVTANGTSTLTITLDASDDLTGIKTEATDPGLADQIDVMPYWTPNSLLGSAISTGARMLLFPSNQAGVNLASQTTIVKGPSSWLIGATNSDDFALEFGQSFVLRNQTATVQTISMVGSVPMSSHRVKINKLSAVGTAQDIRIGYASPVPETIGSLGLGFSAGDRLLVFDNSTTGFNKSASVTLVFNGTGWLQGSTDVSSSFLLQPGQGYIFRRSPSVGAGTITWTDTQSYLQ